MSRTPSSESVPGWYIEFQAALLKQAPRPGEIDQYVAVGWTRHQKSLKKHLSECLVPPMKPTTTFENQEFKYQRTPVGSLLKKRAGSITLPGQSVPFAPDMFFGGQSETSTNARYGLIDSDIRKMFLNQKYRETCADPVEISAFIRRTNGVSFQQAYAEINPPSEIQFRDIHELVELRSQHKKSFISDHRNDINVFRVKTNETYFLIFLSCDQGIGICLTLHEYDASRAVLANYRIISRI